MRRVRYWARAAARDLPERRLELGEDRCLSRGEPHVAGQHELAAGTSDPAFDLRDRDQPARAQVPESAAIDASPVSTAASARYSATRVRSTCEMK